MKTGKGLSSNSLKRAKKLRKQAAYVYHLLMVKKRVVEELLTPQELKRFEKKYKFYKIYLNPESGSKKFIRYAYFWNVLKVFESDMIKSGRF